MKDVEIIALGVEEIQDELPARLTVATMGSQLLLGQSFFLVLEISPYQQCRTDYSGWHIYKSTIESIHGQTRPLGQHEAMAKYLTLIRDGEDPGQFRGIEIDDT